MDYLLYVVVVKHGNMNEHGAFWGRGRRLKGRDRRVD